ncbi:MAG: Polysaccharide biosynthesis protein [Syntrophus sp. PtaU1.Bin208]|nr:MAG: Polysaccharide biosynthesis protein [Syntrophus sp. PtaU1.Bin208]
MLRHYLIYLAGIIMVNGASFLLIPVYATHLVPAEYGILEVIYNCIDVFNIIFSAGLGIASLSIYSKELEETKKKATISTAVISSLCIASLGSVVFLSASDGMNEYFFGTKDNLALFRIAGFLMLSQILCAVPMAFLQARMDSKAFIAVSSIQSLAIITMNIVAVVYLNWRVKGILISTLTGNIVFAIGLNAWTLKTVGWRFSKPYFKRLMYFGLPFIPGGLFLFVLNSADRFFLQKFIDSSSVGIYSLGYKLGTVAGIFVLGPFLRVWGPYMFEINRRQDGREAIGKYFLYLLIAYCMAALAVSFFSDKIIRVISAPGYWEAGRIVPYVLFAYLCWSAAAFFDSGFYITEKTYYKPIIMGVAAAVIFGLYWYLIPIHGKMGGAYATAAGFFVFSMLTYAISQRIYPVVYSYGKIVLIIGYAGALFYLAVAFLSENTWLILGVKSMLLVAYPAALIALGIISREDIRSVLRKVQMLRGAKRGIEHAI